MHVNYTGKKNSKLLTNGFLWMLTAWMIASPHSYNETLEFLTELVQEWYGVDLSSFIWQYMSI